MNTIFADIVENAQGVFENDSFFINPVSKIKLKDVCECTIFLRVVDNKVYIYPFQNHPYTSFILNNDSDYLAVQFGKWVYNSSYYSTKFKPLTYSLAGESFDQLLNPDALINVYSLKDIPRDYYKFSKDGFDNVRILSHLMYRRELNHYIISRLEKNMCMELDSE